MGYSLSEHDMIMDIPQEEDNVKIPSESQPQRSVIINIPEEKDNAKKPSEGIDAAQNVNFPTAAAGIIYGSELALLSRFKTNT
ncbi:hypothetical protein Tco_1306909, partial [Tanacetum coccineum]